MPLGLGTKFSFADRTETTGRELLDKWLNLGSWSRVILRYNVEHPNDQIKFTVEVGRRIKAWMTFHPEEAIEMIKKYDPKTDETEIRAKIMYYAVRQFKTLDEFLVWTEDKPWTKPYEKHYREYYALRSL